MKHASHRLIRAGVVLGAFAALPATAQPSAPSARAPHMAEKKEAKAVKAEAKAERAEARAEQRDAQRGSQAGNRLGQGKAGPDASGAPPVGSMGPAGGPPGRGRGFSGMRHLGEEYKHGRVKKAELAERLAAMKQNLAERRRAHRMAVRDRWGAALAHPACREELRLHARREAFLNRALFLAHTEVTKDKDKLVERIEKLIEKENARHDRAMERLKSMGAMAASAAPAPSAAPAASTPTPAASGSATKAGEP